MFAHSDARSWYLRMFRRIRSNSYITQKRQQPHHLHSSCTSPLPNISYFWHCAHLIRNLRCSINIGCMNMSSIFACVRRGLFQRCRGEEIFLWEHKMCVAHFWGKIWWSLHVHFKRGYDQWHKPTSHHLQRFGMLMHVGSRATETSRLVPLIISSLEVNTKAPSSA